VRVISVDFSSFTPPVILAARDEFSAMAQQWVGLLQNVKAVEAATALGKQLLLSITATPTRSAEKYNF
jgi:hypothetical protein